MPYEDSFNRDLHYSTLVELLNRRASTHIYSDSCRAEIFDPFLYHETQVSATDGVDRDQEPVGLDLLVPYVQPPTYCT